MNTQSFYTVVMFTCFLFVTEIFAQHANQATQDSTNTYTQNVVLNNAVYVEFLGTAITYTVNYERQFGPISVRAGIEYSDNPAIPILVNYQFFDAELEAGLGIIVLPTRHFTIHLDNEDKSILRTACFGYRTIRGEMLYRITLAIIFENKNLGMLPLPHSGSVPLPLIPIVGLSIGYAF